MYLLKATIKNFNYVPGGYSYELIADFGQAVTLWATTLLLLSLAYQTDLISQQRHRKTFNFWNLKTYQYF